MMASMIRQLGLLPAGCQPWNLNMVSSCGPNFAYCATLAVYIYEYDSKYGEYKLTSINASHSKTITCISWNVYNHDLFATGGSDGKVCVWDIKQRKCIATKDKLSFTPKCIGWIPGNNQSNVLAFCGCRGSVTLWNIVDNSISSVDYTNGFDYDVTLFRWHHTDPAKFIFGHTDGSLSLYISGKRNKHSLRAHEDSSANDDDAVLAAIWDPLSSDYLLVARKQSGIQLVDVKSSSVITQFSMPSKMVSTYSLSWVDSAPGMFLTGDHQSGVLRLWSVAHSTPLENINLKSTGFHCLHVLDTIQKDCKNNDKMGKSPTMNNTPVRPRGGSTSCASNQSYSVPPARVVCAFADGGVGLYNLQLKKWEFLQEQGHIETIFDCKFKPSDPKLLATASFDGTVKVWSVTDLTTLHTTTGNEGVIYSIAWAPGDLNCLACGTRRRGIFIWDLNKSKIIRRFKEHGMHAVYCVSWNQRDSHRLASCSDDGTCVVRRLDGQLIRKYAHGSPAFGCEWNLIDKDLLATGCGDGIVRVWNIASEQNRPYKELQGHQAKVFHVRWNPLIRNILCSGSDDKTIRVWEIESQTCTAVLQGHLTAVRGLAWNNEIPYLLASGSWDSSLRLWDVRDEKCIETVTDHGADVYGLATHPLNPFTIATSSRDSTLRIWSLAPMTRILFLKILAGDDCSDIVATPEECMKPGAAMKLAGNMSKQLILQLQDRKNQDTVRLRWFSELFCSSRKLENLWDLVCIVRGQRESSLSTSYKDGIIHMKHLTKYKASEAQESEHSQAHKSGVGSGTRHRDKSLMRAAELHVKLGNMQRHCEILVQLGQWERAMALAPAVSKSFWSDLVSRYAAMLESENDKDCVTFHLASGHVREAISFMTSQSDFQDALLVAQSSHEGNTPLPAIESESNGRVGDAAEPCDDLVSSCCSDLAERHYRNADPYTSASIHLAHDDIQSAVDCLVKSNKLSLALCLSRNLKGEFHGSVVAARMLSWKCESLGYYDIAVKLLKQFDPSCATDMTARWSSLHALCARCDFTGEAKESLHKNLGFPSPAECSDRATALKSDGSDNEAMQFYLISDQPQIGLELGVDLLMKKLSADLSWTVDGVMNELGAVFCIRSYVLKLQSNKVVRTKLLAVSTYFGALLAIRRNYTAIVKPLLQQAKAMTDLSRGFDPNFPLSSSDIQDELQAFVDDSGQMRQMEDDASDDVTKRVRHRAGTETQRCMTGTTVVNASDLPSHSDVQVSTISRSKISGAPYFLEDGRTVLSLNEAVMWAKCNPFSPTASGNRICPF